MVNRDLAVSTKCLTYAYSYDPVIPPLGTQPAGIQAYVHQKTSTGMYL